MEKNEPRKIAIIRRNGFGDLICTIPMIGYCRNIYPKAAITLFVDKSNSLLVPYIEKIDKTIIFPKAGNKYINVILTALKARRKNYDLAISGKPSPQKLVNFFMLAIGAKKRVACVDNSWHSSFINCKVPFNNKKIENTHQALSCLHLLKPEFDSVPYKLYPMLRIPSNILNTYGSKLRQQLFEKKSNGPVILIACSNNRDSCLLTPKKYSNILNVLYEKYKFTVVISCLKKDIDTAEEVLKNLRMRGKIMVTEKFDEFMVLISLVNLLFIGEGGTMHLAAGLNKHQVVLFGGTSLKQWHPLSDKAICLRDPNNVNMIPQKAILTKLEKKLNLITE